MDSPNEWAQFERREASASLTLERLQNRRAVRLAVALGDGIRKPGLLPRRLRAAWSGLGPIESVRRSGIDRLLRDTANINRVRGLDIGLKCPYPNLRVLWWSKGSSPRFRHIAPHVKLERETWCDDVHQGHLDLVWIELTDSDTARTPNWLSSAVAAAHDRGVPIAIEYDRWSRVPEELSRLASFFLSTQHGSETTSSLDERFVLPMPSIDAQVHNPIGRRLGVAPFVLLPVSGNRTPDGTLTDLLGDLPAEQVDCSTLFTPLPSNQVRTANAALVVPSLLPSLQTAATLTHRLTASGVPTVLLDSGECKDLPLDKHLLAAEASMESIREDLATLLQDEIVNYEASVRARRDTIWQYDATQLFESLLPRIGIPVRSRPLLSVLLVTRRPEFLDHAVRQVASQSYPNLELICVLHGDDFSPARVVETCRARQVDSVVLSAPASWLLGDCLNFGLEHCRGEWVAKMDDDDYYAPEHLQDLMVTAQYSGADIVGRAAHYVTVDSLSTVILVSPDKEERFVRSVAGPTIVGRRAVLERVRFSRVPRGVDKRLFAAVNALDGRIYSGNHACFVLNRHGDHTWQQDQDEFRRIAPAEKPPDWAIQLRQNPVVPSFDELGG